MSVLKIAFQQATETAPSDEPASIWGPAARTIVVRAVMSANMRLKLALTKRKYSTESVKWVEKEGAFCVSPVGQPDKKKWVNVGGEAGGVRPFSVETLTKVTWLVL